MSWQLGRYAIEGEIGRGGMGVVYRALDQKLGKSVAIKVLSDTGSMSQEGRNRLRKEARSAAILNHSSIVAVYDYEEEQGTPYIVYEFVEGQTLDKLISAGPLPESKVIEIGSQIAGGLAYAHERGILHRDIKPQNIMVAADGRAKILDFGLAKRMSADLVGPDGITVDQDSVATLAGTIVGTVQYMSPEQVSGEQLDGRTDVFSLGTVLCEMTTGKNPFLGQSLTSTVGRIMSTDPPVAEVNSAKVSDELREIILTALRKRREERYQSAILLKEDLDRLMAAHTGPPGPASLRGRAGKVSGIIPRRMARVCLILLQFLYLALYSFALYFHNDVIFRIMSAIMPHLGREYFRSYDVAQTIALAFLISGACGIAVRLFLMVSVAFDDPETGRQFRRLFPFLFVLDESWALAPLLLIGRWPPGIALLCVALLAYLPISHLNLVRSAYK